VVEGTAYGPGLYAHAVVSKCADALPLHRTRTTDPVLAELTASGR
jgi:transposase